MKTRLMTQAATGATPYSGVLDCVGTMYATEGVASFFSGLGQRSLYMGPLWVSLRVEPQCTLARQSRLAHLQHPGFA